MNIKPLKTEADYEDALSRINELMDASPDTKEGDELDVLTMLVENFEAVHHTIDTPDPVQAIKFQMEHFGLKDKDLIPYIGQSGRVSEVLAYKRKLTLPMIRKLEAGLNIPARCLIQDYELKSS